MSDNLGGPRLKIARAHQHIYELNTEVGNFAKRKPYRLVLEANPDPGLVNLTFRVQEQTPEYFGLMIGDVFHNLRSALDQLACAIVPNGTEDSAVQFPFTRDATTLEGTISSRHIDRADSKAVDIIRGLKPYGGGNDDLAGIRDLNDTDKHRMVIPLFGMSGISGKLTSGGELMMALNNVRVVDIQEGQVPITMPMPSNLKLGDDINVTFTIAFGKGPFEGQPVITKLTLLANYILRDIIPYFEPFAV